MLCRGSLHCVKDGLMLPYTACWTRLSEMRARYLNKMMLTLSSWPACCKTKETLRITKHWHLFISPSVREWPVRPQQWRCLPSSHPPPLALGARLLLLIQWGWILRRWWVLPEHHFPQTLLRVSRESPRFAAAKTAQSRSVASEVQSNTVIMVFSSLGGKMLLWVSENQAGKVTAKQ